MAGSARRRQRRAAPLVAASIVLASASCAREADPDEVLDDLVIPREGTAGPRAFEDHWHAAYGVYLCDGFLPAEPEFETAAGIHTHGDGVIHVHPFVEAAAGPNATLGVFLRDSAVELADGELAVGGERYGDGDDCGGEPATVRVAYWEDAGDAGAPEVVTEGAGDLRFRRDGEAFTIAFAPEGADIPPPPTVDRLAGLGVADGPGPSAADPGDTPDAAASRYSDPQLAAEVLGRTPPRPAPPPPDTPADALEVDTLVEGDGEGAAADDQVTVHYVGVLPDGTTIDASWGQEPFPVLLGQGQVIPGWEEGLIGVRIGERRRLVIGADNAYGAAGTPDGAVPPDTPLAFEVDVIDITP